MFINFSNHPSVRWSAEQTAAAIEFGDIVDVPFPDVPAGADTAAVSALADEYCARILDLRADVVLVQGEMSLSFAGRGQAPEERRRRSVRVQRAGLRDFRA